MVEQDITVYRGSHATLDFTVSPVENIASWTITFTVARANGSGTKAIGPVTGSITSAPAGTYRVSLTSAETDIRPAGYRYDVWRVDAGQQKPLARGTLSLVDVVRLP